MILLALAAAAMPMCFNSLEVQVGHILYDRGRKAGPECCLDPRHSVSPMDAMVIASADAKTLAKLRAEKSGPAKVCPKK